MPTIKNENFKWSVARLELINWDYISVYFSSMRTRTSSPYKHLGVGAHLHSNPENGSSKNSTQRTGSRLNFKTLF